MAMLVDLAESDTHLEIISIHSTITWLFRQPIEDMFLLVTSKNHISEADETLLRKL